MACSQPRRLPGIAARCEQKPQGWAGAQRGHRRGRASAVDELRARWGWDEAFKGAATSRGGKGAWFAGGAARPAPRISCCSMGSSKWSK